MRKYWLLIGLLASAIVLAAVVSIDLGSAPYKNLPAVQGVNQSSITEVRGGAMSAAVGAYMTINGTSSIQNGQTVNFTYPGGVTESGTVVNKMWSDSTQPMGNFGNCDLSPCDINSDGSNDSWFM